MYIHPHSLHDQAFVAWRSPGRFTKNPDLVQLPSGRLLFVYSDTDAHWSQINQVLTLVASDDGGKSWYKFAEVAEANLQRGDERLVTPRLSLLSDGRLVVLCDHDDDSYFHEDQPSGNWAWWSHDGGKTWSEHQVTGIKGFEPDRMVELPGGRLAVCSHLMRGDTQEFAEILSCSDDGGKTWYEQATIAHDGYHRFCEGALVILDGGAELACVMRENHSAGIPSFVSFSRDMGRSWTAPQMLPFALHRPYAKQLPDGRVFVTGRHVSGGIGTYGWCGDLRAEAGTWQVGGPRRKYDAALTDEALVIRNRPDHECRYTLLPPESSASEILFEAEVKIEGPHDQAVAFMSISKLKAQRGPVVCYLAPNRASLHSDSRIKACDVDFSDYRRVSLVHRKGLLQLFVDGEKLLSSCVFREEFALGDFYGGGALGSRTQFGQVGDVGQSAWRRVAYRCRNPKLPEVNWRWEAADGLLPDAYQRRRLIQIHGNVPDPRPDMGYSSWVLLDDGRIMFVDYTNYQDERSQSHIVGAFIDPKALP